MPSRLLWDLVPAFRVPSRWDPLLMATIVPLGALGLQAVARTIASRRGTAVAIAVVGVVMLLSFAELGTHPVGRFRTVPVPPEYSALRDTPAGTLAEYPLGYSDIYRLWQRTHGRPLVNGAPPGTPPDIARLALLDPAAPGTAQSLALLGVTAIAIHPNAHVDTEVPPNEPHDGAGYRLVGRFPDASSVWDVVAAPAPAFVTLVSGFTKPRRVAGAAIGFPLVASSGVALLEIRSRRAQTIEIDFEALPPAGSTRTLRVADNAGERVFVVRSRTTIAVDVAVGRGVSQLFVKVDPAATSESDAVVLTQPHARPSSATDVLHPTGTSNDPGF
jgi:hypothetical protein